MAEPALILSCVDAPADKLFCYTPDDQSILLRISEMNVDAAVNLSERSARELFNWLGVQLHVGDWS